MMPNHNCSALGPLLSQFLPRRKDNAGFRSSIGALNSPWTKKIVLRLQQVFERSKAQLPKISTEVAWEAGNKRQKGCIWYILHVLSTASHQQPEVFKTTPILGHHMKAWVRIGLQAEPQIEAGGLADVLQTHHKHPATHESCVQASMYNHFFANKYLSIRPRSNILSRHQNRN